MEELRDKKIESILDSEIIHFQKIPPVMKLIQFDKGELLNHPLKPMDGFLLIIEGNITIYDISRDGSIRYVSRTGAGTLIGEMEFIGVDSHLLYTEASEPVLCLSIPFKENREVLENDPVFLRFVLSQLAKKLSMSSELDAMGQTLEEKVLLYLRKIQPDHEICSVNETMQIIHCSRRQLQRVLKKLCDEGTLVKTSRGHYRLKE